MGTNSFDIGEKLKKVRAARSLSLDEAAALTGVSKPMLGQIEREQSVPTVTTLWKIATGLKLPCSYFLEDDRAQYDIADPDPSNCVTGAGGKMRAYPLSPTIRSAALRPSISSSIMGAAMPRTGMTSAWKSMSSSATANCS